MDPEPTGTRNPSDEQNGMDPVSGAEQNCMDPDSGAEQNWMDPDSGAEQNCMDPDRGAEQNLLWNVKISPEGHSDRAEELCRLPVPRRRKR